MLRLVRLKLGEVEFHVGEEVGGSHVGGRWGATTMGDSERIASRASNGRKTAEELLSNIRLSNS